MKIGMRGRARLMAVMAASVMVVAACTEADGRVEVADTTTTTTTEVEAAIDEATRWPVPDWSTIDADDAGLDPRAIEEMAALAEAGGSNCLVVTHDGRIVGEWYWNGTDEASEREAFSATKSITSTLVGIAQDLGHLDIDQPASDFITEWVGTPSEDVTIRNLLTNDSGRYQTAESDYIQMATREADKTAYSIGLEQQHAIGTVWVYNNAAIQTLEAVLERATGRDVGEFATEHLFEPLGMTTTINKDLAGNTLTFMGAQMSCRDMAKFGLLFLRGGEWNGTQIVPADYAAAAVKPSTELNAGYGYLWWLFDDDADADAELVETAPGQSAMPAGSGSAYAALGLGGQIIAVFPEHDIVVSRLSGQTPGTGSFGLVDILTLLRSGVPAS